MNRRRTLTTLGCAGLLMATCAPALGATVSLVAPSPAGGALIQTQPSPYALAFAWVGDVSDCTGPGTPTSTLFIYGPNGFFASTSSPGPSGQASFTTGAARRSAYTWFVDLTCPDGSTTRSRIRSFTLQGPNPEPRLQGSYWVTVAGTRQLWRFAPRCAAGACATLARRPGSGWFRLSWSPARRTYVGRLARVRLARERSCTVRRRRESGPGTRQTVRNAYGARNVTVRLRVTATGLNMLGTATFASRLTGEHRARYVPTARGARLGCRAHGPVRSRIRATRR
jgi:hypothetical protein